MKPLSDASKAKLTSCDARLQSLVEAVVATGVELVVCCGHRNKSEQDLAFKEGKSKLKFPESRHNSWPSQAVDLAPAKDGKIDWNDLEAFRSLAVVVKAEAFKLGIALEWGGDWKRFVDRPHWELKKK